MHWTYIISLVMIYELQWLIGNNIFQYYTPNIDGFIFIILCVIVLLFLAIFHCSLYY